MNEQYEWEQEAPAETEEPTEPDTAFAEAEERLLTAQYYRVLLGNSFFDDDSATAQKVEKEIRAFVRGRMEVLLGIRQENAAAPSNLPFTEEEVATLKVVAGRVLAKPSIAKVPKGMEPPSSQQLPPAPKGPSLKKASVPASVKDRRPGVDAASKQTAAAPRKPKNPNPNVKTATALQYDKEGNVTGESTFEYEELPPNPETGAMRIKRDGRILERRVHPHTNAEIWANITPQASTSSAIKPVPTGHHMETIMQQKAEAQANQAPSHLADLIADSLSKPG